MKPPSRRTFLATCAAATLTPYIFTSQAEARTRPRSPSDRLRIGAIGMRYQGSVITNEALPYGDVVAIADVDRQIAEKAREQFGGKAELYEDYRALLDRQDVDVVMIGTPDHWHTRMVIDACRAGKDIYCEKPLTLTIDEGHHLLRAVRDRGAVVQVGTWQRSDHNYRTAVEMIHAGRLGAIKKVSVVLGKNVQGGPFATAEVPAHLNWNLWQGQTPDVPYIAERSHYTFRWWQEYSGGQMTDWGAHHIDIAQWGLGQQLSGPLEIDGRADYPQVENGYNVATNFSARLRYSNGVEMEILDHGRNGILFEGELGRIFVNRGTLEGKPVEDLAEQPLPREEFKLYAHDNLDRPPRMGKIESIKNHMGNFVDCVHSRETPLSDVVSQHRSVSTCHLANISMRLGRPLKWDPAQEQFVGDDEANGLLQRPQRAGFEIPT
ncbi:MAG: Gfo/Idh/MocA family oxidoreductase [Pirellulales bacterium]|nr:Gfo/Idh/MocA family oxidoreductase [Pirellulales bacterium]